MSRDQIRKVRLALSRALAASGAGTGDTCGLVRPVTESTACPRCVAGRRGEEVRGGGAGTSAGAFDNKVRPDLQQWAAVTGPHRPPSGRTGECSVQEILDRRFRGGQAIVFCGLFGRACGPRIFMQKRLALAVLFARFSLSEILSFLRLRFVFFDPAEFERGSDPGRRRC